MAQKVIVQLVDDIDGTQIDDGATVQFGLDGKSYEIDLSAANAEKLRDALAPYISAGRTSTRSSGAAKSSRASKGKSTGSDTSAIREWAKAEGIPVSERGRVAAEVVEAYNAAH